MKSKNTKSLDRDCEMDEFPAWERDEFPPCETDDFFSAEEVLFKQGTKKIGKERFDMPSRGYNNTSQSQYKQNEINHVEPIRERRRGAEKIRNKIMLLMVKDKEDVVGEN